MARLKKLYEDKQLNRIIKHIGVMLKFYREKAKLSQNKLSRISRVSISTINEIENLKVNDIRFSTISTLALHLKIDPLYLIVPSKVELIDNDKIALKKAVKTLVAVSQRIS